MVFENGNKLYMLNVCDNLVYVISLYAETFSDLYILTSPVTL